MRTTRQSDALSVKGRLQRHLRVLGVGQRATALRDQRHLELERRAMLERGEAKSGD